MEQKDISFPRGDTYAFEVVAKRPDPATGFLQVIDLTAGKAWFTAKRTVSDQDASATIALSTTTSGVAIVDALGGRVRVTIPPAPTLALPDNPVNLRYDVQVMDSTGNVTTVQTGICSVVPDVTRATS
jgi:hypothetical protein